LQKKTKAEGKRNVLCPNKSADSKGSLTNVENAKKRKAFGSGSEEKTWILPEGKSTACKKQLPKKSSIRKTETTFSTVTKGGGFYEEKDD